MEKFKDRYKEIQERSAQLETTNLGMYPTFEQLYSTIPITGGPELAGTAVGLATRPERLKPLVAAASRLAKLFEKYIQARRPNSSIPSFGNPEIAEALENYFVTKYPKLMQDLSIVPLPRDWTGGTYLGSVNQIQYNPEVFRRLDPLMKTLGHELIHRVQDVRNRPNQLPFVPENVSDIVSKNLLINIPGGHGTTKVPYIRNVEAVSSPQINRLPWDVRDLLRQLYYNQSHEVEAKRGGETVSKTFNKLLELIEQAKKGLPE